MASWQRICGALIAMLTLLYCMNSGDDPPFRMQQIRRSLIGGTPAASGEWPNVAWLENGCSAVLVHSRLLLYAAHCGENHTRAWLGHKLEVSWDVSSGIIALEDKGSYESLDLEICRTHPNGGLGNDIAYCIVKHEATLPVAPIVSGEELEQLDIGQPTTLVGYGLTGADGTVMGVKHVAESTLLELVEPGEIVTGSADAGSCYGDSGGPVFVQVEGRPDDGVLEWRVLGILSAGEPGVCGKGYYTEISQHTSWLAESGFPLHPCGEAEHEAGATPCTESKVGVDGLFRDFSATPDRARIAANCSATRPTGNLRNPLVGLGVLAILLGVRCMRNRVPTALS